MPKRAITKQTMKASEVRQEWSQVLNTVFRGETRIIVEKSGIPVAAIISAEDLKRLQWMEAVRDERFKMLEEISAAFADVPLEELEAEVEKAVAQARAEIRQEKQRAERASA